MTRFIKKVSGVNARELERRQKVRDRLNWAAGVIPEEVEEKFGSVEGFDENEVRRRRTIYGANRITHRKQETLPERIFKAFINPFTAILIFLAAVSLCTDVIFAEQGEADPITVIIIMTMVMISGVLRFVQETRSGNAASRLAAMVTTTACVQRLRGRVEIPLESCRC